MELEKTRRFVLLGLGLGLGLVGCNGQAGGPALGMPAAEAGQRPVTDDRLLPEACTAIDPGPAPIRRLTRSEYNATVQALLGDTSHPADQFVPEEQALGFNNNASALGVTAILAEQYADAAEALAERATQSFPHLLRCAAGESEDACASRFIVDFGRHAFRRPLDPNEVARYEALYQKGKTQLAAREAVRMVVEAVLLSPRFLYRVEVGEPALPGQAFARLTPFEVASRLSYLLWGSMPDQQLFDAADRKELSAPSALAAQARRLLGDPRARARVADFHSQWLGLHEVGTVEKDDQLFPTFGPAIPRLLEQEANAFFDHMTWDSGLGFGAWFTAPFSFMNAELAAFYGVSGPATSAFERVNLDPAQRAGFLTQAGLLGLNAKSNQTSPTHRGKYVRERLLCAQLPAPPADLVIVAPQLDPNLTTRERFAQHSAEGACKACHQLMDPLGLGFENYDAAGLFRAVENGKPIDASGDVVASDVAGPFTGAVELGQKLAVSTDVRSCMTRQWFRFGYGRAETDADSCSLATMHQMFEAGGERIPEMLVALTQTDAFLYRKVVQP